MMEISEQTKELIGEWYDLSQTGEVDNIEVTNGIYFRFMALWVAFNALYNSEDRSGYGGSSGRESKQIKSFSAKKQRVDRHEQLLREDQSYIKAASCLREFANIRLSEQKFDDDLERVLQGARKVRNNLFHGKKLPGNLEDKGLVQSSYRVVSRIMSQESLLERR